MHFKGSRLQTVCLPKQNFFFFQGEIFRPPIQTALDKMGGVLTTVNLSRTTPDENKKQKNEEY